LHETTFTYTIGGSTDTASAVGGDWRITLTECNVISANLTKVVAPSLSFITTSSVEDLNANLSHRDLSVDVGGDLIGDVRIHSGNLDLRTDNFSGDIEVIAGTLSLDVRGNILAGADAKADGGIVDFEVGGKVDSSIGTHYKLDTNTSTAYLDKLTVAATGQVVSIVDSSSSLTADVTVVFGSTVLDTVVTGNGTLIFKSDGNVRDIVASVGSNVNISSIQVQGNAGDIGTAFENCNTCGTKSTIQNVNVSGTVGDITGGKLVKNVIAKSIGEIKSLFGDVMIVSVAEDIEKICAIKSVQKITACGAIGDIYAGTDIKTIKAGSLGSAVAGKSIYDVNVLGDIGLLDAGSTVKKVLAVGDIGLVKAIGGISYIDAAGDIDEAVSGKNISRVAVGGKIKIMTAATNVTYISAIDGGTIYAGGYAQNCSPNLTITKGTTL
jgi:hypothetical protein